VLGLPLAVGGRDGCGPRDAHRRLTRTPPWVEEGRACEPRIETPRRAVGGDRGFDTRACGGATQPAGVCELASPVSKPRGSVDDAQELVTRGDRRADRRVDAGDGAVLVRGERLL